MTTLYFCSECVALLGDDPRNSLQVDDGNCANCASSQPPIAGEFTEENAETLMDALEDEFGERS